MVKLLLLTRASARAHLRWARERIYSWLILAPLILGVTYATASRLADSLESWRPSYTVASLLASVAILCLIAMSLSRASRDLYHIAQPESYFEALPLSTATHFHWALLKRLFRNVGLAVAVYAVRWAHDGGFNESSLAPLLLLVVLNTTVELFAALTWVHWISTRALMPAVYCLILIAIAAFSGAHLLLSFLEAGSRSQIPVFTGVICSVAAYFLALVCHDRWRAIDIEYARRLQGSGRSVLLRTRLLERRIGRAIWCQVVRDLKLTGRRFSSAVYVAGALAFVWLFALLSAMFSEVLPVIPTEPGWLNLTWRSPVIATKLACLLETASIATLVSVLVSYQLPHFWLERSVGTTGIDMSTAKLWYARLVSLPAPFASWAAGIATGQIPVSYSIALLVECVMLWWLVSSLIGALAFEIPARPVLAVIIMLTVALSAGLISVVFWPAALLIYAFGVGSLMDRARQRARYFLMTGDD